MTAFTRLHLHHPSNIATYKVTQLFLNRIPNSVQSIGAEHLNQRLHSNFTTFFNFALPQIFKSWSFHRTCVEYNDVTCQKHLPVSTHFTSAPSSKPIRQQVLILSLLQSFTLYLYSARNYDVNIALIFISCLYFATFCTNLFNSFNLSRQFSIVKNTTSHHHFNYFKFHHSTSRYEQHLPVLNNLNYDDYVFCIKDHSFLSNSHENELFFNFMRFTYLNCTINSISLFRKSSKMKRKPKSKTPSSQDDKDHVHISKFWTKVIEKTNNNIKNNLQTNMDKDGRVTVNLKNRIYQNSL